MDDRYLFRGKRLGNGEWVVGWYAECSLDRGPLTPCIIPSELARSGEFCYVEVDPSTVAPCNDKWISVKDRLPDSQADVLVAAFWHGCRQTMIGWHSDMEAKWRVLTPHGEREPGGVTHWTPLPELPGEEDI